MKLTRWHYTALQIAVAASFGTSAFADSTQTWVSGVGDDANPCSRTTPCLTLAGAISKTSAGGEINALDPGSFGAVTITKSITINLTPSLGGVQVTSGNAITVTGTGGTLNVTLRGLDIDGTAGGGGTGVLINGTAYTSVLIEDSQIYGFSQGGINAVPSAGGYINVSVAHSRISDCAGSSPGIHASGLVNVAIISSEIHNCQTGLSVAAGVRAGARTSDFSNNGIGVAADASGVMLDSGTIEFCGTAVNTTSASAVIRLNNMTIVNNNTGIIIAAGTVVSFGNNVIKGNTINGLPTGLVALN